ncbi:MAG: serine/threonine-protein kinase [Jaaginema sp. PMC 1079.18]|nr:serine/threonine-protein kinase [Jaaginema sp. PMC 1080.18]MEC4850167.1 serine/threonine-protein kinase [Jaaginema sp. PMC 1079.18]MEC4865100.1 serine/threonine-protein kinase [Jaaginema sp. PMC 1078.18]
MSKPILHQRYQLKQRFSKKGPRQTFLATDLVTQQEVVVKILLFGKDFQWQEYKLFERGANALKNLSHPQIPQYLDSFEVSIKGSQGFAQVQSYIDAPSLQQQLDLGRSFSEVELLQLARQVLDILIYLQQQNPPILHRDIKPSNILLGERSGNHVGQVYLVDFDSVKTYSSRNTDQTMTIVGTYGYMAPEQFGGKAYQGTDLYGLGATLIAIATGKPPSELPQQEFRLQFASEVSLRADLMAWLQWLVEPSLDLRLSSAQKALNALENPAQIPEQLKTSEVVSKPNDSRIILKQNDKGLEVIILPPGLESVSRRMLFTNIMMFCMGLITLLCMSPIFLLGLLTLFSGSWDGFIFACILFVACSIFGGLSLLLMCPFLLPIFLTKSLKIQADSIFFTRKLIVPFTSKNSASKVEYLFKNTHQVVIQTKNARLRLPTTSQQESDWLAHHLSLSLKLPIQYPEPSRFKNKRGF